MILNIIFSIETLSITSESWGKEMRTKTYTVFVSCLPIIETIFMNIVNKPDHINSAISSFTLHIIPPLIFFSFFFLRWVDK